MQFPIKHRQSLSPVCIDQDMTSITMFQYSVQWFQSLFKGSEFGMVTMHCSTLAPIDEQCEKPCQVNYGIYMTVL